MSARSVLAAAVAIVLMAGGPAVAQAAHKSVTATGVGHARVHPKNRHRNSSIVRAVAAARKVAIKRAARNAHKNALLYANAVGFTLGSPIAISDQQLGGFYGPGGPGGFGFFGPNRYCGTIKEVSYSPGSSTPTVKKIHRCIVPRFVYTSLVVTYSAS
jgi:hypothetical protein